MNNYMRFGLLALALTTLAGCGDKPSPKYSSCDAVEQRYSKDKGVVVGRKFVKEDAGWDRSLWMYQVKRPDATVYECIEYEIVSQPESLK